MHTLSNVRIYNACCMHMCVCVCDGLSECALFVICSMEAIRMRQKMELRAAEEEDMMIRVPLTRDQVCVCKGMCAYMCVGGTHLMRRVCRGLHSSRFRVLLACSVSVWAVHCTCFRAPHGTARWSVRPSRL
jgi:hypothetical protein